MSAITSGNCHHGWKKWSKKAILGLIVLPSWRNCKIPIPSITKVSGSKRLLLDTKKCSGIFESRECDFFITDIFKLGNFFGDLDNISRLVFLTAVRNRRHVGRV